MSIFTIERREEVESKLLNVGIELIKEKGIRSMTISEVTTRAGIGKGTFYHFYPSKEIYIYSVIQFSKDHFKQEINRILASGTGIKRCEFEELLTKFSFQNSNNIVHYITSEDECWLNDRLPRECVLDVPKEDAIMEELLVHMKNIRKDIHTHVIANMMKIMAITVENRDMLHEDVLEENLKLMREMLCDYIFEQK